MNYPRYDILTSTQLEIFEFVSDGKKGKIEKIIQFEKIDFRDEIIYNLAFGDKKYKVVNGITTLYVDDSITSENGDRDKILATVAAAVYEFTAAYCDRLVIFTGSDDRRTRLYRMALSKNYDELSKDFDIFGLEKDDDLLVRKSFNSGITFFAYLIKRKIESINPYESNNSKA